MPYDHWTHADRFGVWTAGRAAQRTSRGISVSDFRLALESTGLRDPIHEATLQPWDHDHYSLVHIEWCRRLLLALNDFKAARIATLNQNREARGKTTREMENATFGVAAKALNVFVKTKYVLKNDPAHASFIHVAHPPIDSVLLANLRARHGDQFLAGVQVLAWTRFGEPDYQAVIAALRTIVPAQQPFWMIEEYWSPQD